jgi:hypothetical protein
MDKALIIKLSGAALIIGAIVATQWTPDAIDTVLYAVASFVAGAVGITIPALTKAGK